MANPNVNRINTTLSAGDIAAINSSLTDAQTKLQPHAQALTPEERESLFGLQEENLVFAKDALTQGQILNASLPPTMQLIVTNLTTDISLFEQMEGLYSGMLQQLTLMISDTKRLAAHESFAGALGLYKYIEAGAALGLAGYQAAYDVLKTRFAGQGGSTEQPQP
ncbi:MAG: hypothetical protein ACKVPJ_00845 [Chitinophagales bacterium]